MMCWELPTLPASPTNHSTMVSSTRRLAHRSNPTSSIILKAFIACIALNVLVQILLHLRLDSNLLLTSSSLSSPFNLKQEPQEPQQKQQEQDNQQHSDEVSYDAQIFKRFSRAQPEPLLFGQPDLTHFTFSKSQAEAALSKHGRDLLFQPLRAYIEKPLNDTVPNTVDTGNLNEKKPKVEVGRPGKWYVPLPLREGRPEDLRVFEYGHKLKSCHDLPAKLPIDRGFGDHATSNVNNRLTYSSGKLDKWGEAKEGCPVSIISCNNVLLVEIVH